jgi:CRISPR-associated protein Csd1
MLHQVVEYARRQDLAAEPGFAPKDARWAVLCTRQGAYLGLVELGDTSLKKNSGHHFLKAPDFSFSDMKAGGVTKSHFLIETAGVVAGYGKDAPEEKHRYFVSLLKRASEVMPALEGAAKVLQSDDAIAHLRSDFETQKAKATDKTTFQIDGEFPVESDEWHAWWREFRRGLQTGRDQGRKHADAKLVCFLTGEVVEPAATHPKIKGLTSVGGLAMGDVLIGFKQESFRSYGLEQSANAAMSELAAKGYQAGLNDLIASHSALLAGTLVAHWFRSPIREEEDPMDAIMGPSETEGLNAQIRARKLLDSIRSGERPDLANNTYYALTLSSNGGRVIIRDWMEGSFEELVTNVDRWFSDLEIVQRDGGGCAGGAGARLERCRGANGCQAIPSGSERRTRSICCDGAGVGAGTDRRDSRRATEPRPNGNYQSISPKEVEKGKGRHGRTIEAGTERGIPGSGLSVRTVDGRAGQTAVGG